MIELNRSSVLYSLCSFSSQSQPFGCGCPLRAIGFSQAYHCFPKGGKNRLGRAIRTERYRLVEWKKFNADTATAEYELYDYDEDPLETKNLAADQPDVVQSLAELLASHPEAKPKAK